MSTTIHKFVTVHRNLRRGSNEWLAKTNEVYRLDRRVLDSDPTLRATVEKWYIWLTVNSKLVLDRMHLKHRLSKYLGALSINKKYIELTGPELEFILNLDTLAVQNLANTRIVEVGFNKYNEICKLGIVIKLPDDIGGRFLFLCIGTADGGLKTCYVTPQYKSQAAYKSTGNIPYLSATEFQSKINPISN